MPHKRNPVLTENLTGLARWCAGRHARHGKRGALARARHLALFRRARCIGPDATVHARLRAAPADRRHRQAGGLSRAWSSNIDKLGGLVHSQRVLLALTQNGRQPRGCLSPCPAQRHEGLATRPRAIPKSTSSPSCSMTRMCANTSRRPRSATASISATTPSMSTRSSRGCSRTADPRRLTVFAEAKMTRIHPK
jgi:hypothetical protein